MKTKFIDFEGIHGSGKSSSAWFLYNNLLNNGINAKASFEAYIDEPRENLLDFSFMSVLRASELENVKNEFPEQCDMLVSASKSIGDYFIIYYPLFKNFNMIHDVLSKHEVYGGRLNYNDFKNFMVYRFSHFVEKALNDDLVYVCESVLFQQIINELLRFTESSKELIAEFIDDLIKILSPLNPVIFYLKSDNIKNTISNVASERLSDNYDLYPDWIDWMLEYVKNSRYGIKFGVKNQNDLLDYFNKRVEIEDYIFESLDVNKQVIQIDKTDKDSQNKMIYEIVARIL